MLRLPPRTSAETGGNDPYADELSSIKTRRASKSRKKQPPREPGPVDRPRLAAYDSSRTVPGEGGGGVLAYCGVLMMSI